jgi:hypothetical protein
MGFIGNLEAISEYNSYREKINGAYFKIEGVFVDTEKSKVRVPVRGWLSEYARQNSGIGIFKRVFYIPMEEFSDTAFNKNAILARAYEYIKALPEFADAEDALEPYAGKLDITQEDVDKQANTLQDLIDELKSE